MKSFFKFILIIFIIGLLSAVLAPILYRILPMFKFERIFNRLIMIGVITASVLFVRIRKDTLSKLGLSWRSDSLYLWACAFIISVLILSLFTGIRILAGTAEWAPRSGFSLLSLLQAILYAFGAAMLIGVIEEFFFRGFIYQYLSKRLKMTGAVFLTSVFYSLVHFVDHEKPYISDQPTFFDSLKLITAPLPSLSLFSQFWMAAFGLFLFGLVLNFLVIRADSLYPSIGLHSGCVFFIKMDGWFVNVPSQPHLWFGTKQVYDGILGWVFIIILGLFIEGCRRCRK